MGTCKLFILFIHLYMFIVSVSSISIENHAYKGISISISESVNEQNFKIARLKDVLIKSSEIIYHATRKRSYFGEFSIFYPSSWTAAQLCGKEEPATKVDKFEVQKVDIHLTSSDETPHLTTKHSRGCGLEGDRIHMSLEWLNGNTATIADLARQFVKQWSIYRYGVFEEKSVIKDSCYLLGKSWTPVGCYNVKYYSEPIFENGPPNCSLPSNFTDTEGLKSSLMSDVDSPKVLDFCDGSSSFPHNPAMPTLHNTLCKGRTVWSVIENSLDFKYGMNLPLKNKKPPKMPVFKCLQEKPVHVIFAIQTNTVPGLEPDDMSQIGYTLYEFLRNMPPRNSKITGVSFSDQEDPQAPFELDITDSKELFTKLQFGVKTFRPINKVCLSCGLQKAINVASTSPSPLPIVAVIAWKSALVEENPADLVKTIKQDIAPRNISLHLILVEDTEVEDVSVDVVHLIRSLGGLIYSLPKERVFRASKLLVTLASVFKNPMQVEDRTIVVHERRYSNISKNFVDSFIIPPGEFKKMLYIMYCLPKLDPIIYSNNTDCKPPGTNDDSTFKCSEVLDVDDKKALQKKYSYTFTYFGTSGPLHCSSVAILLSSPTSKNSFTLKGWFSEYVVKVPQNVLIIYVEITGFRGNKFKVEAQISGPGLESPFLLELRDNGNGDPDTKAGDGIYSRYFTKFSGKGIYTVTVSAEMAMTSYDDSFFVEDNPKQGDYPGLNKTIGFFYVINPAPKLDILPPNRVADLSVISVNHTDRTAELQWTAPGGDYDFGEAKEYEVYYSEDWKDLQDSMLSKIQSNMFPSSEISPKLSGQTERAIFQFPDKQEKSVYYVALRAVDSYENKGQLSNTVQIVIGIEKTRNNTNLNITGDGTETSTDSIHKDIRNDEDFSRCYVILGGAIGVLLFIIIINIIIWLVCFQKYKKRWKELQNDSQQSSAPLKSKADVKENIPEDTKIHAHSYTNPIMEEYSMPRDSNGIKETTPTHPQATYALVTKKVRRNEDRDSYPLRRVDNINIRMDHPNHRESDLGLV